nr:HIT family protein [Halomonas sp. 1513]
MSSEILLEEFRDTFRLDELTIIQGEHWILSVRPEQITLGSMVLSSSLGKTTLSQLTAEEGAEMAVLLGEAENLAKDKFGSMRINVLCLMMKDPIVHFHIFPRYDKEVEVRGVHWRDEDYPAPPSMRKVETSKDILEYLANTLQGKI